MRSNPFLHCLVLLAILANCRSPEINQERLELADEIEHSIQTELLNKWYPQAMDTVYGGFLSSFTFDFKPTGDQNKMIVSQARHVWTTAKASMAYPEVDYFLPASAHGVEFLKNVMWDKTYGGFHTHVDRQGNVISNPDDEKTAYGNAFGIYGLAAYAMASRDTAALSLAKKAFLWLEEHSHDPIQKGYFQHMKRDGSVVRRDASVPSTDDLGYKDQNSSIHLLEAFTELYQVWPDPLVAERLKEMLMLIRDTITDDKGSLTLFLQPDWTPVSFRDSSEEVILKHHNLDHVSFGHDVETAYLLLEASHVAGIKNDTTTLRIAKKMVDHALMNGWDSVAGGFYDEGYYFSGRDGITITRDTKNWWAQAEGLNTLLMMADLFPDDEQRYFQKFSMMWDYIDKYLIDHEHGEWYSGGLDKQPQFKTSLKGHIWKACYHQYRSMENSVKRLRGNTADNHQ
ncbi:MAG: AGE family epimerase/isomerase [Cyclobacteriaceae bacterium]